MSEDEEYTFEDYPCLHLAKESDDDDIDNLGTSANPEWYCEKYETTQFNCRYCDSYNP